MLCLGLPGASVFAVDIRCASVWGYRYLVEGSPCPIFKRAKVVKHFARAPWHYPYNIFRFYSTRNSAYIIQ